MDGWRERAKRRFAHLKRHEGMTQTSLAADVGVEQSTISMWFLGHRSPDTLLLYESLAHGLKMHPAEMLYGIEMLGVDLYERLARCSPEQQAAIDTLLDSMAPRPHRPRADSR